MCLAPKVTQVSRYLEVGLDFSSIVTQSSSLTANPPFPRIYKLKYTPTSLTCANPGKWHSGGSSQNKDISGKHHIIAWHLKTPSFYILFLSFPTPPPSFFQNAASIPQIPYLTFLFQTLFSPKEISMVILCFSFKSPKTQEFISSRICNFNFQENALKIWLPSLSIISI